jgi:hypothetical protein
MYILKISVETNQYLILHLHVHISRKDMVKPNHITSTQN